MSKQSRHGQMVDILLPTEEIQAPANRPRRNRCYRALAVVAGMGLAAVALAGCGPGGKGSPAARASSAEVCQGLTKYGKPTAVPGKAGTGTAIWVTNLSQTPLCLYSFASAEHRLVREGPAIDKTTIGGVTLSLTCERRYGNGRTFAAISVLSGNQTTAAGYVEIPKRAVGPGGDLEAISKPPICVMPQLAGLPVAEG
jgi:hypothetical protein